MNVELDEFLSLAESDLKTKGVGRSDEFETGLRKLLLENGRRFVELLFNEKELVVPNGERLPGEKNMGQSSRNVLSIFGPIRLSRTGYYHPKQSSCRYPLDDALLLIEGFTPAAAKLAGRCASDESFVKAGESMEALAGIDVEPRRIQRLVQAVGPILNQELYLPRAAESLSVPRIYISADGTGIPLRKGELKGRKGKQPDGAAWLHRIAKENFPQATRILDFYHASEYLHEVAALLWPEEVPLRYARWRKQMKEGKIKQIIDDAQKASTEENKEAVEKKLNYFRNNLDAMRYDVFRAQGMFIGSGVIEAGCKTVVGKRCKQSGMFWNESGVENILTLRVARQNGTYDSIWTNERLREIRNTA